MSGGVFSDGYQYVPLIAPSEIWSIAGHAAPGPVGAETLADGTGSERAADGVAGPGAAVQPRTSVAMRIAIRPGMGRVCACGARRRAPVSNRYLDRLSHHGRGRRSAPICRHAFILPSAPGPGGSDAWPPSIATNS